MKNLNHKSTTNQRNMMLKKGFLLILLSAFLSNLLIASERTSAYSLTAKSNTSILLELPGNLESNITVSIYDIAGFQLHQEVLLGETVAREYNLNKLPSGEYTFEISFNQTKKWKHIKIVNGTLQTLEEDFQMIIEPTVQLNDGQLDLNMLCFSDSKLSLNIYDAKGNNLLEEQLEANGSIAKRYNLNSLKAGEYQVLISSTDYSIDFEYSKTVKLKSQKDRITDSVELASK